MGAVLAEQHDEWHVGRRYGSNDSLLAARTRPEHATPPIDDREEKPALPDAA